MAKWTGSIAKSWKSAAIISGRRIQGRSCCCKWTRPKSPRIPITDFIPQHPTVYQEKYPKVGDPNPAVQLGVVSAGGGAVKWFHLTDDKDMYMPRFGWVQR